MSLTLPWRRRQHRKPRQHHGSVADQLGALDRGLAEMALLVAGACKDASMAIEDVTEFAAFIARVAQVADDADAKANSLAAAIKSVTRGERWQGEADPGSLLDRKGFPGPCHPESMDAELPGRDEEWLAALAAALWPQDEYVEIVRRDPPGSTP